MAVVALMIATPAFPEGVGHAADTQALSQLSQSEEGVSQLSVGMSLEQVQEIIEVSDPKPVYPDWLENFESGIELSRSYGMQANATIAVCDTADLQSISTAKIFSDKCTVTKVTSYEQADSIIKDARDNAYFRASSRDYILIFDSNMKLAKWELKSASSR